MKTPVRTVILFVFAVMCCNSQSLARQEDSSGNDSKAANLRVVLRLTKETLKKLSESGFAKAAVTKNKNDQVVSLRLVPFQTFIEKQDAVKTTTKVNRDVLEVEITDEILRRLSFQPLEIPVMKSGFSKVLLVYNRSDSTSQPPTDLVNRFFIVRKEDGNGIYANVAGDLGVKTNFGLYSIPFQQIEAVHFSQSGTDSVILKNGDKLTAEVDTTQISIRSEFGTHEFETSDLFSLTKSNQHRFLRNSMDGDNAVKFVYYNMNRRPASNPSPGN